MRIFIITMDDPVQTNSFISQIIESKKNEIIGLAISKGDRLTIQRKKSKFTYLLSLFLIMGFYHFVRNSFITIIYKIKKKLYLIFPKLFKDPSIARIASENGIKTLDIKSPNNEQFLDEIRNLNIDVIINQSQNILKSELLAIPKIGVINRHNALLPKNRGRLTPFWVLFKGEKETGVSIHFVNEELDAGDVIVQKKFPIEEKDNFNTIVKKNYELAPAAMLEALDKLKNGYVQFIKNDSSIATYNTTPTLKEAWQYRKIRLGL
ncbi:MAG TPA: formyltransferase family protein [Melioribacteraceae bacterium]|nr:formyltransferase family protein [Melioribacteraceae bacterium]